MIKGSTQQEDITLTNTYAPKTEAPKYIKQILTYVKGEMSNDIIIVRDFNKISKALMALNDVIDQDSKTK